MVHSSAHGGIATTFDAIPGDRFTLSNQVPVPVTPTIPISRWARTFPTRSIPPRAFPSRSTNARSCN